MSSFGDIDETNSSSSSSTTAPPSLTQWESLRKRARQLESSIYRKLQELAQVQTEIMNESRVTGRRATSSSSSSRSAVDLELGSLRSPSSSSTPSSSSVTLPPIVRYDSISVELSEQLRSFSDVCDGLARMMATSEALVNNSNGTSSSSSSSSSLSPSPSSSPTALQAARSIVSESNRYLITKNRDILHMNQLEFTRTKANIQSALTRQELLSDASARHASGSSSTSDPLMRPQTAQLLREGRSLQQSIRMTDDIISQALAARDSLFSQGAVFFGVRHKLERLGSTFPIVGQLMNRISASKQRDMIVLACVIATCLFFTILYVMARG